MAGKITKHPAGEAVVNLRDRETEERITFRAVNVGGRIETTTEAGQRWIIESNEPGRLGQRT